MFRKSQAALEFLTTYAWAFLVILVMVGALAYFGILNPSKLLPDRCNFGSEITCDKNRMIVNNVAVNTLQMELTNNFGEAVTVTDARITSDVATLSAGCATIRLGGDVVTGAGTHAWSTGDQDQLQADCAGGTGLVADEKIKINIEIDFFATAAGSTYEKTIFGEIFTSIQ